MTKRQRKILAELNNICNSLGGSLDGTSTSEKKYKDRQEAHMLVSTVLYGVICDDPENDFREEDIKRTLKALEELKELQKKTYPDRNGSF